MGLCSLRYPLEAEASPSYNPLGQPHSASPLGGAGPPDACRSPSSPIPATPQHLRRRVDRGGQRPARVPPSQSNPGVGTRRCNPEASGTLGVLCVPPTSAPSRVCLAAWGLHCCPWAFSSCGAWASHCGSCSRCSWGASFHRAVQSGWSLAPVRPGNAPGQELGEGASPELA